ncbi:MAG TPA: prolipoprotein diacylglyceryl transferase family protein [Acidobacteriaceae bacterium]|jgi:phosphatidylglycerol:prolipoprotein diacylglycerol transferase|nr:prolipoprotein diacylglyceryl transferase family protein [Acidobacteriaceae bacterium]
MYPYLNLGSWHIGTFGLLLWLAAVCATVVLHRNFVRHRVDADALNVVALAVVIGIIGAKLWHEFEDVHDLALAWRIILHPGWHHPLNVALEFLRWFQAGFAWFGGLLAAIAVLIWQGRIARFKGPLEGTQGERVGALRMLDLAAPAAALGYGIGRIGCLLSGDGDYGINTTLPWGVHMMHGVDQYHRALVLPHPPTAMVQPTPIYELLFSIVVCWILWKLGERHKPIGWLTGMYLLLTGIGRFLVEFVRINPKPYFGMSNAQVAALGSAVVGIAVMVWATRTQWQWAPELAADPRT